MNVDPKTVLAGIVAAGAFIAAFSLVIAIRRCAKKDTRLGRFCRWYWNLGFKITAYIPFCSWMTMFMIADTEEEKAIKADAVRTGERTGNATSEYFEKRAREEQRHKDEEKRINDAVIAKYGSYLVSYDPSTNMAELRNGKKVEVKWEEL